MDVKKRPIWQYVLIVIISLFLCYIPVLFIIGIMAFDHQEAKFKQLSNGSISVGNGDLLIERNVKVTYDYINKEVHIIGYLKNKTKKEIEDVSLSYELYDKKDNIIGTASAYIEFLPEGKTWKFVAVYSELNAKEVANIELNEVDYF